MNADTDSSIPTIFATLLRSSSYKGRRKITRISEKWKPDVSQSDTDGCIIPCAPCDPLWLKHPARPAFAPDPRWRAKQFPLYLNSQAMNPSTHSPPFMVTEFFYQRNVF
jgi:hypothetical protein